MRAVAQMDDPFPDSELEPLTDEWTEAGATRCAVCLPNAVRDLDPNNLTIRMFGRVVRAAQWLHGHGAPINVSTVLSRIKARERVEALEVLEVWDRYDLGNFQHADVADAIEVQRLACWRDLRTVLLRAAAACERQDRASLVDTLTVLNDLLRTSATRAA